MYGPERVRFYQQASAFLGTLDPHECLVLGGDFNTILKVRDRSGVEKSQAAVGVLRDIGDHRSLVDIWRDHHPDDDTTFTYVWVGDYQSRHSQLECIYFSHFHLAWAHGSGIQPAPFSDHHLVTVTASLSSERLRPAYWHFNNSLLEDVGFVASFWEFWLAWRGQQCTFLSARKRRGAKKHVTCLLAEDGTPLMDPEEMRGSARAFYVSLLSPDSTDAEARRVLWTKLLMVSTGDQDRLELPLSLAKLLEALHLMPTNKSPGMDRLTVEFYCVF
ncbi:unnamed protein product [Caretta caretta]